MYMCTQGILGSAMQEERYSIGYFVWPRHSDVLQGPQKKYPPITYADYIKVRL